MSLAGLPRAFCITAALFVPGRLIALDLTPERLEEMRREVSHSVVKVEGVDRQGQLVGTGFFIDSTGTIATSYSVGGEADDLVVTAGELRIPARRVVADKRSGLAFLKIEAGTPSLKIREETVPEGTMVAAFGFPMGGALEASSGRVVARQLRNGDRFFATTHLRALIPAQPGLGGAPILDAESRVAGIVISKTETSLGCFALPGRALLKVQSDHLRFGEVRHAWLGIELAEVDPSDPAPPPQIAAIADGGPAARGGLKPGDLILGVGSDPITSAYDLLDATFFLTAGDPVKVSVERGGSQAAYEFVAGDHPSLGRSVKGSGQQVRGSLPVSGER